MYLKKCYWKSPELIREHTKHCSRLLNAVRILLDGYDMHTDVGLDEHHWQRFERVLKAAKKWEENHEDTGIYLESILGDLTSLGDHIAKDVQENGYMYPSVKAYKEWDDDADDYVIIRRFRR